MKHDTFEDLAFRAEFPPPAFHTAILRAQIRLLNERPDGVSYLTVGSTAWRNLTDEDRGEALALMLGSYAADVCVEANDQQHEERLAQDAADPGKGYLAEGDTSSLWDSVFANAEEVEVDRQSLMNVLCELELLQYRLAMRAQRPDAVG